MVLEIKKMVAIFFNIEKAYDKVKGGKPSNN